MLEYIKSLFGMKPSNEINTELSKNQPLEEIPTDENIKLNEVNSITKNTILNGNDRNWFLLRAKLDDQYNENWAIDNAMNAKYFEPNIKEAKILIKEKKYDEAFRKYQEVASERSVLKTLERTASVHSLYYGLYCDISRMENLEKSNYHYLYQFLMNIILGNIKNLSKLDCGSIKKYYDWLDHIIENSFNLTFRNKNYFEIYLEEVQSIQNLEKIKNEVRDFLFNTFPLKIGIDPNNFTNVGEDHNYPIELQLEMRRIGLRTNWDWVIPVVSKFVNSLEVKYIN